MPEKVISAHDDFRIALGTRLRSLRGDEQNPRRTSRTKSGRARPTEQSAKERLPVAGGSDVLAESWRNEAWGWGFGAADQKTEAGRDIAMGRLVLGAEKIPGGAADDAGTWGDSSSELSTADRRLYTRHFVCRITCSSKKFSLSASTLNCVAGLSVRWTPLRNFSIFIRVWFMLVLLLLGRYSRTGWLAVLANWDLRKIFVHRWEERDAGLNV
jgi:hypothetical protein